MKTIALSITALEPLIFSERSATTGGHRALDYVPGAALLGLAAQTLYKAESDETFRIFHAGAVRFGNGYPVGPDGSRTLPMPRALHAQKGDGSGLVWNRCRATAAEDGTNDAPPANAQLEQQRRGFLSEGGGQTTVPLSSTLRTAVDPSTGTALTGALYTLSAIPAGATFLATLSAEDADAALLDRVVETLGSKEGRAARIGRSRSAEFGRVKIKTVGEPDPWRSEAADGDAHQFVLCCSDLWLLSTDEGRLPVASELGLDAGDLDLERSFIAYRTYTPFNAFWRVPEGERRVIAAGSVLAFRAGASGVVAGRVFAGLGQSAGLGELLLQPAVLRQRSLRLEKAPLALALAGTEAMTPPEVEKLQKRVESDPLFKWMKKRTAEDVVRAEGSIKAADLVEEMLKAYRAARRFNAVPASQPIGPGRTQWMDVMDLADVVESSKIIKTLFEDSNAPARASDPDWSISTGPGLTFRGALRRALDDLHKASPEQMKFVLGQAARRMADEVQRQEDVRGSR